MALKEKTGESSIKEAISKTIYHFLKCQNSDEDKRKNTVSTSN
jgi:hypothetical protein